MTRGQQVVLLVMVLMLAGVTALLVVAMLDTDEAAPEVPTLAALITATAAPAQPAGEVGAAITAPPTWTSGPTRTPPATNTPRSTSTATLPPTITPTFAPTFTPRPTPVVTPTAEAGDLTAGLQNPGFEGIQPDAIPGWDWWAEDNFTPGGAYNPDTSFDTPLFKRADDPLRVINGPTLQVDGVQHLKFRVHVYQTVPVSPTARVRFEALAGAYSGSGVIQLAAGIDPEGGDGCGQARWGRTLLLDQNGGVQPVVAPQVNAGEAGLVTVCLYAEPVYAAVSNAAFFDDAELTVNPP